MAFEVMLSPGVENARKPRLTPRKGNLSKQRLEEKQQIAEKNRKVRVLCVIVF